jgi:hypothetical protein
MLVMDIPSLALYLFPMVVLFTSQLMFFDKLDWMEVDVVGKHWLNVFYTGQWMNKIYGIFKATCWKWDEYKWIVGFGSMFLDNGWMLVVIFLIWVSLSTMILIEVFLMSIPKKGIVMLGWFLVDCWIGFVITDNQSRGSVRYGKGTGKDNNNNATILF